MLQRFKKHISENFPQLKEQKLLVAVSGGLDSVVLTQLCHSLKFNISIAHCNFNLRGKESDADAKFVKNLTNFLNVRLHQQSFNTLTYSTENKLSTQVAARQLRYQWFSELAKEFQYNFILTAHHLNDSIETFLINFTRGTGLDGLTGIPQENNKIIRPLLPFSRNEIYDFATKQHYKWREDSSNASDAYLRNAIRHHVVPKLEALNSQFLQNAKQTQQHLAQHAALLEDYTHLLFKDLMTATNEGYRLSLDKLSKYNNQEAILYQLLKDFEFSDWQAIVDLQHAQSGKFVTSRTHRLVKHKNELLLTLLENKILDTQIIDKKTSSVEFSQGTLTFQNVSHMQDINRNTLYADLDKLEFPLTLRPWQSGDRFQPFGMKGSKKLSDFFNDENLSLPQKEKVYVLTSNKHIVWVVGYRTSNRFKITENTSKIIKIIWQS